MYRLVLALVIAPSVAAGLVPGVSLLFVISAVVGGGSPGKRRGKRR